MSWIDLRMHELVKDAGDLVTGVLAYTDPSGQRWIAPIGSPPPDLDKSMPAEWVPIEIKRREDVL